MTDEVQVTQKRVEPVHARAYTVYSVDLLEVVPFTYDYESSEWINRSSGYMRRALGSLAASFLCLLIDETVLPDYPHCRLIVSADGNTVQITRHSDKNDDDVDGDLITGILASAVAFAYGQLTAPGTAIG